MKKLYILLELNSNDYLKNAEKLELTENKDEAKRFTSEYTAKQLAKTLFERSVNLMFLVIEVENE